ncbi:MAG: hypothetical protein NUV55_01540 [Sulfuricaulis sp.]|nr:hypothetical protein [Sulfuricaulis sp.]MCR4345878.1 hypothetical protein [Sulfuricaulis sp.]
MHTKTGHIEKGQFADTSAMTTTPLPTEILVLYRPFPAQPPLSRSPGTS